MNQIFSLPATSKGSADWIIFLLMILAIGLAIGTFAIWYAVYRPKPSRRKRRRKRHQRQHNPTLAEKGGLPPMRSPDEPPAGT